LFIYELINHWIRKGEEAAQKRQERIQIPQLGVEWYNKDKFSAALISVLACIIYKKNN